MPPSSTGTYSNFTPVRRSITGKRQLRQVGIRAAEIELKFNFQGTYHRLLLGSTRYVVSDLVARDQPAVPGYKSFIQF